MHIDENGDAEGNYTVLSRQQGPDGSYTMRPVGHFEIQGKGTLPVRLVNALREQGCLLHLYFVLQRELLVVTLENDIQPFYPFTNHS